MRIVNRITGIEGLAAGGGGTSRIKIPTGVRYHQIKLATTVNGTATLASTVVSRVRLEVDGKTVRDVAVTRLLGLLALNGLAAATGELPILFSDHLRSDKMDETIWAFDTRGFSNVELILTLNTLSPGTDVPGVTGVFIFDTGATLLNGKPILNLMKQVEVSKQVAAGVNDWDNFPISEDIHRVHFYASTGSITAIEVQADDVRVWEATNVENTRILRDYGLDTAASGAPTFPLVFDFTEQVADYLRVASKLNIRLTCSAAATVTAVLETRVNRV